MKHALFLVILLMAAVGCGTNKSTSPDTTKAEAKPVAFNVAGAPTVMFEVPDMVCESCSAAVQETLAKQPGAKEVIVDLEEKVATVAVDEAAFDKDAAVAALLDKQFPNAKLLAAPSEPAEPAPPDAPAEPEHKDG